MNGAITTAKTMKSHEKWLYDIAGGPEEAQKMIEEGHKIIVGKVDYKQNYPTQQQLMEA